MDYGSIREELIQIITEAREEDLLWIYESVDESNQKKNIIYPEGFWEEMNERLRKHLEGEEIGFTSQNPNLGGSNALLERYQILEKRIQEFKDGKSKVYSVCESKENMKKHVAQKRGLNDFILPA